MNRVSAFAFNLGYIGSTTPYIISLAFSCLAQNIVIPLSVTNALRAAFLITANLWICFSIPMFRHVHQRYFIKREPSPVAQSFRRLGKTMKEIGQYRAIVIFLIAYFFYIDGVGTIISMSTA